MAAINLDAVVDSPRRGRLRGTSSAQIESELEAVDTAPEAPPPSSSIREQSVAVPETVSNTECSCAEGKAEGSDNGGGGGGGSNASKKPVWNKPSNGVVEVVSPVMGAVSWPALGESTKASPKASESLKALSDGLLIPALQVTGNSSPSHKQSSAANVNPSLSPNNVPVAGQRAMKRGSGSSSANAAVNGRVSQPPPSSHDSVVETPHNTSRRLSTVAAESSPRDPNHKESQRGGFGHGGSDHHPQRNFYKRGNGGQHPRGDGSYHHNYGGKRDQDRGNQEWNHGRNFNNRDPHLRPQRGGFHRGYIRPSVHNSTPFIPPPMPMPGRPFGNTMMYPDVASSVIYVQGPPPPESFRAMPLVAPVPPPMYFAFPDPQLHAKIVSQIDYYFSNENLVKDTYLRQNMDEQGWVPVTLIAGFKKVKLLTNNVPLILDAMRTSTVVEVQNDKIRCRNDWMRWLLPSPAQYSNLSSPQSVGRSPSQDALASQLQGVSLDGATSTNQVPVGTFSSRSSSGEFGSQLQQAGGEGTARQ